MPLQRTTSLILMILTTVLIGFLILMCRSHSDQIALYNYTYEQNNILKEKSVLWGKDAAERMHIFNILY